MRSFIHPSGLTQRLAVADLTQGGAAVLRALARGRAALVYSDPPWNPGNEKWWRRHAGLAPPRAYDDLLDAWCAAVAALVPEHVWVEQSVNPAHRGLFDAAVARCAAWRLPYDRAWTVIYGSPRRPNALLHFGAPVTVDPSGLSGPALLRCVFTAVGSLAGRLVADPCTGLGTTSRVAHEFGAHFIGTELNPARLDRTAAWLLRRGYVEEPAP